MPIIQKWDDGNDLIFEIAKHVYGWGRVHACGFLEPETWEIRQWFLAEGVDNGYEIAGLSRESYVDGVWNKDSVDEWLTEIQLPVK